MIKKNIEKIKNHKIEFIAPSHGPIYDKPSFIIDAYRDWISDEPKNVVVIPYASMHGSTKAMVDHLVGALAEKGISVYKFDLAAFDVGRLAMALVDAATIVVGTPTMHAGPHPNVFYAVYLANALKPKLKFASIIGSYGWNSKTVEQIAGLIPDLKVEMLESVLCKGLPREDDFRALDDLATIIAKKHKEHNLV